MENDFGSITWILLGWFAAEALLFAIFPSATIRFIKNFSPRGLRVIGIVQVVIVIVLLILVMSMR